MRDNNKKNPGKVHHYDPVCRRKINKHQATYIYNFKNELFLLCCPECQTKFENNKQEYMDRARRFDTKTHKERA